MDEPIQIPSGSGQAGAPLQGRSPTRGVHWPSVLQLGFSLLGMLFFWGVAAILFLSGLGQKFLQGISPEQALPPFLLASGAALCGFLLLPAGIYAFRRLAGLPSTRLLRLPAWLNPGWLILVLPIVLLAGNWIYPREGWAWLFLPPLQALAVGIPILWFVHLSIRGIASSSPQRHWGVFNAGLVLAPLLSFIFEMLAALLLVLVWSVWASTQPDLLSELTSLAQRLDQVRFSQEEALALLEPYLTNPAVISAVLLFLAAVVPLVEEFVKPIGIWALANRGLRPTDGFVAGVLCGAGFALAESLAITSTSEGWVLTVTTRIGTGAIHILASGLVGWALARAWGNRKFVQLGATFLLAVLLHGTWNALSVLLVLDYLPASLRELGPAAWSLIPGELIPYAFALLAFIACFTLLGINRLLYRQAADRIL